MAAGHPRSTKRSSDVTEISAAAAVKQMNTAMFEALDLRNAPMDMLHRQNDVASIRVLREQLKAIAEAVATLGAILEQLQSAQEAG
jgi:hypothetical protein